MRRLLAVSARFLFGLAALFGATVPARADRFKYAFRPGQVIRTRASLAAATVMGSRGSSMVKDRNRLTLTQTLRVISLANGVATLDIRETPVGQPQEGGRAATRKLVRLTERGRFISRKDVRGDASGGAATPLDALDVLYGLDFPDRDLKPGDRWEDTLTVGGAETPQKVQLSGKFVGWDKIRGRNCARIDTVVVSKQAAEEGDEGGLRATGKITARLTTYFDPRAGVEVYSSGNVVILVRADLSQLNPEAGDLVRAQKINFVQSLVASPGRKR